MTDCPTLMLRCSTRGDRCVESQQTGSAAKRVGHSHLRVAKAQIDDRDSAVSLTALKLSLDHVMHQGLEGLRLGERVPQRLRMPVKEV